MYVGTRAAGYLSTADLLFALVGGVRRTLQATREESPYFDTAVVAGKIWNENRFRHDMYRQNKIKTYQVLGTISRFDAVKAFPSVSA